MEYNNCLLRYIYYKLFITSFKFVYTNLLDFIKKLNMSYLKGYNGLAKNITNISQAGRQVLVTF